jgi:hypothetical protein
MAKQVAPSFPFAPDEIVVAIQSFAAWGNLQVKAGARLRGDDAAVRSQPQNFILDGTTDAEKHRALQALTADADHSPTQHIPRTALPKPLRDEDAVIVIKRIPGGGGIDERGRTLAIEQGQRVATNDPRISRWKDHIVSVVGPGMTAATSVRAVCDSFEYRRDASGEFILENDATVRQTKGEYHHFRVLTAGQWVSHDHPLVSEHPSWFEVIPQHD